MKRSDSPSVGGVVTALGTPLDEKENLHEEGMRLQVEMQLRSGVNAFLVLGSMGAMQLLKDETFQRTLAVTIDAVDSRVPVIVGCGDTSSERTLKRIRWAEEHPVSGVALLPPYFFSFSQTELLDYFRELAAKTHLPVYLYDNPGLTKHSLEPDLIVELSKTANIVGLKQSGSLETVRYCAEYFSESADFGVLSGLTQFFDVALDLGADGIVDGLFALAPELGVEIWRSFQNKDATGTRAAQIRLNLLRTAVLQESFWAGFTTGMNLRGIPGSFVIRPASSNSSEAGKRVGAVLQELELI